MLRRALILAAILVIAPVSYTALLILAAGPVFDATWFWFESVAKAQVWSLILVSPAIVATKAWEFAKRRGLI